MTGMCAVEKLSDVRGLVQPQHRPDDLSTWNDANCYYTLTSDVIKGKCQRTAGLSTRYDRTLGHDWTLEFISHTQDQISCLCIPIRTKTSFTDQYLPILATAIGAGKCLCFLFFYSASPSYLISTSWRSFMPINVTKQKFSMGLL